VPYQAPAPARQCGLSSSGPGPAPLGRADLPAHHDHFCHCIVQPRLTISRPPTRPAQPPNQLLDSLPPLNPHSPSHQPTNQLPPPGQQPHPLPARNLNSLHLLHPHLLPGTPLPIPLRQQRELVRRPAPLRPPLPPRLDRDPAPAPRLDRSLRPERDRPPRRRRRGACPSRPGAAATRDRAAAAEQKERDSRAPHARAEIAD
jgi:hypothetical protein